MTYKELRALPAEAYLEPERFRSVMDGWAQDRAHERKQYEAGLDVSRRSKTVHIAVNSVWSADLLDGGTLYSYEGIGYHANTADLLSGFLDGPAEIVVHRLVNGEVTHTSIKLRSSEHAPEVRP